MSLAVASLVLAQNAGAAGFIEDSKATLGLRNLAFSGKIQWRGLILVITIEVDVVLLLAERLSEGHQK